MDRGAKKEQGFDDDDDDESSRIECQLSHLPETENEGGTIREIIIIIIEGIAGRRGRGRAGDDELYGERGDE